MQITNHQFSFCNSPPTSGSFDVDDFIWAGWRRLIREPVEQVVAPVVVKRATQTLSDSLRRDVDLDVEVLAQNMTNNLVAGWHLNLQLQRHASSEQCP